MRTRRELGALPVAIPGLSALSPRLVLLLTLLLLAPRAVRAQEAAADAPLVQWTAPPSCPSRAVFEAEVEHILGRRPEGGPYADVAVTVRGGRHTATLTFGPRRRRIEAVSCEGLVRAAALVVALEIDPDALSLDAPEPEDGAADPSPATAPLPAELVGSVEAGRALAPPPSRELASPFAPGAARGPREPDVRFLGGVGLAVDHGALPSLAPGVWLGASVRVGGMLELGLEGRFLPEQRAHLAPRPQVGADLTMLAGRVRVGLGFVLAHLDAVSLELSPLAALELGAVSGTAVGLMTPLSASSLWWALDTGLELRAFFLDALGVFLRGELEITLRRSAFVVEGYSTPVFRAADAGFVGLLGVLLRSG